MLLPNFFIVGAAKAGTTSLHAHLSRHPDVYMSPIKEPNYFSRKDMRSELFSREYQLDIKLDLARYLTGPMDRHIHSAHVERWEDYLLLFRNAQGKNAIGEASPSYLYCSSAAEELSQKVPNARIVMILRNPVERAFSHYLMNLRLSKTLDSDFIREVEADYQRANKGWGVSKLYLELGLYSEQIRRFKQHFPSNKLHIIIYDDYRSDPDGTMAALCRFLGIDEQIGLDTSRRYNDAGVPRFRYLNHLLTQAGVINAVKRLVPDQFKNAGKSFLYSRKALPKMSADARTYLADFYREDVKQLSELLGRDMSFWVM